MGLAAGVDGADAGGGAALAGASRIIAVDVNPARLKLARELGATETLDPARVDPVATILERTGSGVDFALNTTDLPEVYLQGIASLGPKGTFAFVTSPRAPLDLSLSPILLGGPITAVDDVGVPTIARALRWQFDGIDRAGPDLVLSLVPR